MSLISISQLDNQLSGLASEGVMGASQTLTHSATYR